MNRFLRSVVLTFILVAVSFVSVKAEGLDMGDAVEDFTLINGLTKKEVNFASEIKGRSQYTAIIFANSSCGACRKEMATLSDLSKKYKGFTTYVILVDMLGADIIEDFAGHFKFDLTYLLDPEFNIPPMYGFYFTPSLLIVNEAGTIIFKKGGYRISKDKEVLTQKVDELMK